MADDPHDEVRARLDGEPSPPMPADVAARLHDALAAEAQARQTTQSTVPDEPRPSATVTELPKRGRWKAPLLAAAGVVAVVAVGIPVINQTSNEGSGDAASSGSSAPDTSRFEGAQEAPDADSPDSSDQAEPQQRHKSMVERFRQAPMDLHRTSFASDVSEYLGSRARSRAPSVLNEDVGAVVSCTGNRPTAPDGLHATLDGDPAVVLTSPSPSDAVRVRAVVCGEDGPAVAARATLD